MTITLVAPYAEESALDPRNISDQVELLHRYHKNGVITTQELNLKMNDIHEQLQYQSRLSIAS